MKKMIITAGILFVMSLAVYGCGKSETKTFSQDSSPKELFGDIQDIGDMQFTVSEIITSKEEDGTEIAISVTDESEMNLITVAYDEETYFYKRTIRNGGADYEDSDASSADLKKGVTAEMKGNYERDVFHASEIQLVEVIY